MAEVSRAPVTRIVRDAEAEGMGEHAISLSEPAHSPDTLLYPVEFPFEWCHKGIFIAKLEKLSEEELRELAEKNNGTKNNSICALCGESKELGYRKESGNVSHLICEDCAVRYVQKALALRSREPDELTD
jgi:superfamily II helicase